MTRVCLDLQELNKALQREHFKLPTLDDILSMSNVELFYTVDIRSACGHILLDEESIVLLQPFQLFTEDIAGSVCIWL